MIARIDGLDAVDRLVEGAGDIEQSCLGAIMLGGTVTLRALRELIAVADFAADDHRIIFGAACTLQDAGSAVDAPLVIAELERTGQLTLAGGRRYIAALVAAVPTAAHAGHYANLLRQRADLRRVHSAALGIANEATRPGADAPTLRARFEELFAPTLRTGILPLIWSSKASPELDVDYIVKGIIAAGELCVIYGPPKSGKTFLTIDLALHVAAGLPWFGHRVRSGLVIYIASEMGVRAMRRVRAWIDSKLGNSADRDIDLACVPMAVNLLDDGAVNRLFATIKSLIAEHGLPIFIVIDTLARSMIGGDENSAKDMGRVISIGDRLRDEFNAATVIVHHSGKTTASGARGSSALLGAADTMLRVEANDTGVRVAEVEWCRDGEAGARLGFKLKAVNLGLDSDGDPVSTCIVEPLDAPPAIAKSQRVPKGAETALRALREVVDAHGERLPGTSAIPPGVKAVSVTTWRERFYYHAPLDVDAGSTAQDTAKAMDARRKQFGRIRDALQDAGLIGIAGDFAWFYQPCSA